MNYVLTEGAVTFRHTLHVTPSLFIASRWQVVIALTATFSSAEKRNPEGRHRLSRLYIIDWMPHQGAA